LPLSHRRRGPLRNAAPAAPQPAQIDRNGVLILIRSTVLALDQANKTGNYTVLRDLGAPGFPANTAARLAEIFARSGATITISPASPSSIRSSWSWRRSKPTA
jgi:hypothetical protein